MKKKFMRPVVLCCICLSLFATIEFFSCSKDSGSGSGNGNGNTGGNGSANSVSIKGFAFSSATLNIKPGTTVTWTNNDAATHTVTADDGSFDSGNIATGGTFKHTFSSAGTIAYHCSIHTTMTAKVVISN